MAKRTATELGQSTRKRGGKGKPKITSKATRTPTELGQAVGEPKRSRGPRPAKRTRTELGQAVGEPKVSRVGSKVARQPKSVRRTMSKRQRRAARQKRQAVHRYQRRHKDPTPEVAKPKDLRYAAQWKKTGKTGEEINTERLMALAPKGLNIVRALVGDKPGKSEPTLEEVGNIAYTLGTGAALSALAAPLRGAAAARAAKAAKAANVGTWGRSAPAVGKAAARTRKAVGARKVTKAGKTKRVTRTREASRTAKAKTRARYAKPQRRVRRTQRTERAVHRATSPAAIPAEASEGGRAFIEGTLSADPKKSLETTAKAIPASLAFFGTALADTARSAKNVIEGKDEPLAPLKGTAEEAKSAVTALEPLVSGDPEKVKEATENELGYVFAPLLPAGISRAGKPVRAAGKSVKAKLPKGAVPEGVNAPGRFRRAGQIASGRKTRKKVSTMAQRNIEPERLRAERAEAEILKPARKAKKSRRVSRRHGVSAEDAIPTLARYGIPRKNPKAKLDQVERSLKAGKDTEGLRNVRAVKRWLDENPDVLKDKKVWEAVDAAKRRLAETTTSPRKQYQAQARVLSEEGEPILAPEQRVRPETTKLTGERSREGAFDVLARKQKELAKAKGEARKARTQATEAKGARREELQDIAVAHRNNVKRLEGEIAETRESLRGLTLPGQTLKPPAQRRFVTREGEVMQKSTRRKPWDKKMVEDFVKETQARARAEGWEEPAVLSERTPGLPGEGISPPYPAAGRAPRVSTGKAEAFDMVDRSFRAMLSGSIRAPRMQRGLDRFVRQFTEEMSHRKLLDGKERIAISSAEAQRLIANSRRKGVPAEQKIDLRKEALLPSRQFNQPIRSADFDLAKYHSEVQRKVKGELDLLADEPGTTYIVTSREAAAEFADQINPQAGVIEQILGGLGTAGTRTVLFSPAWTMAQVVAEGAQAVAAVGPVSLARALARNEWFRRKNPKGFEDWSAVAGESRMAYETAAATRLDMDGAMQGRFADGIQAFSRTKVGRAIMATGTLKLFGIFDRWKTGKLRSAILSAKADKALNGKRGFIPGLQGMTRTAARVSDELKGKSRQQQLDWLSKHPKAMEDFAEYLDDVAGNWNAFSRFERQFSPALMFYPYLRMSLRWGFWTFPKRHPVRAQILYLLAQRNREELAMLLGHEPDFLESAMPVVHGEEGEADLVLPGGRRFGTPALNVLVESIGEDNIAGVFRALNPALSIPIYSLLGVDPMSGRQQPSNPDQPEMVQRGLLALNQLLTLSPAARYAELNRVGKEDTPAGQAFENIDPAKAERSILFPFLPLSGERARLQSSLSEGYEDRYERFPEVGYSEAIDAVTSGDRKAMNALKRRQEKSEAAKDVTATVYEGGEELTDEQWDEVARILGYRKFPYEKPKKKSSSRSSGSSGSSSGGAYQNVFGGGSSSSGGGGAYQRVFGN